MYSSSYYKNIEYTEWTDDSYESNIDQNNPSLILKPFNNEYDTYVINKHFGDILNIDNRSKADIFVNKLKDYFSVAELVKLYYNISNRATKKYKQVNRVTKKSTKQMGGQVPLPNGPELTKEEQYIYRFLLVFDTIHDFKEYDRRSKTYSYLDKIQDYIANNKHCFPLILDNTTGTLILMPITLVENEEECINKLSTMPKLQFLDGTIIENPFYKLDISTLDIFTEDHPITYKDFVKNCINKNTHNSHKRSFSVEIFGNNPNETDKSIYRLEKNGIIRLLYYINEMTDHARLDFQLDNVNEPFCKLLFSLSYIKDSMDYMYRVDPDIVEYMANNQLGYLDKKPWFATYSDSNLFDPSITFVENDGIEHYMRDNRPTGSIYDINICSYQVYLDGVKYDESEPHKSKINTHVTIAENQLDDTFFIYDELSQDTFSFKNIRRTINDANVYNHVSPPNANTIPLHLYKYTDETILALKRAGDWGQVEHCKRYNKIFVTGDRYAALYAYFRKVPSLLIRTRSTLREDQLNLVNIEDIEQYPGFTKFSFIILNPERNLYA